MNGHQTSTNLLIDHTHELARGMSKDNKSKRLTADIYFNSQKT